MSKQTLEQALESHRAGALDAAASGYLAWLSEHPHDAAALHLLGVLRHQQGRNEEGLPLIDRALALAPDVAPVHANRAAVLTALGQDAAALAALEQATSLDPSLIDGLRDQQARLCLRLGAYAAAAEAFRGCVDQNSNDASAWAGLALALHAGGDAVQALPAYRIALQLAPGDMGLRNGLGAALLDTGDSGQARAVLEQAALDAPPWGPLWANLGNARRAEGDLAGAAAALSKARDLEPANATTLANLCAVLAEQGALADAVAAGQAALAAEPGNAAAQINLAAALFDRGAVDEARALWLACGTRMARTNALYAANFAAGIDEANLLAQARQWADETWPTLPPRPSTAAKLPDGRLRIGFVSPDLRSHSVAWFLLPVLPQIDKTKFELHAFSELAQEDAISQRLKPNFASWTKTVGMDDDALAATIRARGIDVLIDLAGHTAGNRLAVFAQRPARAQMSWLGYPGPTGLRAIDWRLSDADIDPGDMPGAERPWRLATGAHVYALPPGAPDVALRPDGAGPVFGSFNNWPKHSPECIETWAQILRRVPQATLLFKNKAMADEATAAAARAAFAAHGIDPARILCRGRVEDPRGHLALYGHIDIALDPFPYNGTTTTCEALAMGVPVIALRGNTPAGRVAAAFVARIGRPHWACDGKASYIAQAVALALDVGTRAKARQTLRAELTGSKLGDATALARTLETAWQQAFSAG
ncbi:MAG: tetratricopeptide repeat protein [Telmatospirillum sp.]|nr:tetratricopeptide repeat protein [Telmatospirillum sp.]